MAQATFGRILRQVLSNVIYLRISGYHLHPKSSYKGEASALREECECRKYIWYLFLMFSLREVAVRHKLLNIQALRYYLKKVTVISVGSESLSSNVKNIGENAIV